VDIHFEPDAHGHITGKTPIMDTVDVHPLLSPISAALARHYHYYISCRIGVKENTPELTELRRFLQHRSGHNEDKDVGCRRLSAQDRSLVLTRHLQAPSTKHWSGATLMRGPTANNKE
jgi:hypothetical protein